MRLLGNLVVEITGGNLARAFGKRLDRDSDLFGEEKGQPHHRKKQKNGEERQDQEHLTLQSAEVLFFGFVFLHLGLNDVEAGQKIRASAIARRQKTGGLALPTCGNAGYEIILSLRLPDLHAARKGSHQRAQHSSALADLTATVFRLFIANHTTA